METHFKARVIFLITMIALLLVLSCCSKRDTKVRENLKEESSKEQFYETVIKGNLVFYKVSSVDYYTSNMHYKLFLSGNGGIFVVNITKDSLECIKLRK